MSLLSLAAEYAMFPPGALALCALSGGADSMYLTANLLRLREDLGITVAAAHFDHGLRPSSAADAQFVRDWCAAQGIPCVLGRGDVAGTAAERGRGIEETARSLRYAFLQDTARELGAAVIATAHTADDNAETLLMHLVRGSGLEGLCGIPPRRGNLVRPLLDTTRAEIEGWLSAQGVPHVEDETNADLCRTRNFLRHRVMPLLSQVNPQAALHMTAAAARLRRDNDVLNAQGARVAGEARAAGEGWVIAVKAFDFVPDPVALRAVRQLILRTGGKNVSAAHLGAVLSLLRGSDPSAMVCLPGVLVRRVYGEVLFTPARLEDGPPPEQEVAEDGTTLWGEWELTCRRETCPEEATHSPEEFWLAAGDIGPLLLRSRREGDTLQPPGRPRKSVKKWLIDEKIPRLERETVPVLWAGGRVAAVGGIGPENSLLARAGAPALHITIHHRKRSGEPCIPT